MKEIIKAFLIVSFLGIMIPMGKLTIPNGGILLITSSQIIEYSLRDTPKLSLNFESLFAVITSASLVFIVIDRKQFNLIGIILQFCWLSYFFKIDFLKYWCFTLPTSIYLILSIILLFYIFIKKNQDQAINDK